jgi:hypothetical protein
MYCTQVNWLGEVQSIVSILVVRYMQQEHEVIPLTRRTESTCDT